MINIRCPVKRGSIVSQEGDYDISGMVVRGGTSVTILAMSEQDEGELSSGLEVDLPSFLDLCKRVLVEAGALPKWFFFGVIVDASHSQLLTYFSPSKEQFFSDIYNYIKGNIALDLPTADTESVVKSFFENNRDYLFNYIMIPLDSMLTGSLGGRVQQTDIRF